MSKNKAYVFAFGGKILECESLLELRSGISEEEWSMIVAQTAEFYLQLNAVHQSSVSLDRADHMIMRQLSRTLKFIKKLDPISYSQLNIEERKQEYKTIANNEIQNTIDISYGNEPNKHVDIVSVNRLD